MIYDVGEVPVFTADGRDGGDCVAVPQPVFGRKPVRDHVRSPFWVHYAVAFAPCVHNSESIEQSPIYNHAWGVYLDVVAGPDIGDDRSRLREDPMSSALISSL